jgi:hypothetical protein
MKTNIVDTFNAKQNNILPLDIKKFITLGFIYVIIFVYYLVNFELKQYFIIYKFFIFFITFTTSFSLDIIFDPNSNKIIEYFSIAVMNSIIAVIVYSIFTDLSINGMFDNFSVEKKIGYLVMSILLVLCSINLIHSLIS